MSLTPEDVVRLADLKAEGIYIGEATVWAVLSHRFRCLQAEAAEGRIFTVGDFEQLVEEFARNHEAALHILKTRFPKFGTDS